MSSMKTRLRQNFVCVKNYLLGSVAAGLLGSGATLGQAGEPSSQDKGVQAQLSTNTKGGGSLIVEAHGILPKAELFYKTSTKQVVTVGAGGIKQVMILDYTKLQGRMR